MTQSGTAKLTKECLGWSMHDLHLIQTTSSPYRSLTLGLRFGQSAKRNSNLGTSKIQSSVTGVSHLSEKLWSFSLNRLTRKGLQRM